MASSSGSATYVTVSLMHGSIIPTWRWDSGCTFGRNAIIGTNEFLLCQVHNLHREYSYITKHPLHEIMQSINFCNTCVICRIKKVITTGMVGCLAHKSVVVTVTIFCAHTPPLHWKKAVPSQSNRYGMLITGCQTRVIRYLTVITKVQQYT